MASQADENSPPRSDLVVKTRRQSALLDSPSRLTRSQSRRLSNAPVEAPMSPLPAASRRRSVRVSESLTDAASLDDVVSIQDESESVKPAPRIRRSTRRSFADTADEGPLSTRGTKLTSIEEDSKPVTRRTRASLKPPTDTDSEISLPTTRRTRRSSVSSVTSVSTIASNVSPKPRRGRPQKNLSPVPSPTYSEASALSEVPEVSPNTKKISPLPGKDASSASNNVTPVSAVSPAKPSSIKSAESAPPSKSSPVKESSPMSKRSRTSLSAPRQLQLEDSNASKRASLDNVAAETDQTSEDTGSVTTSEDTTDIKSRRSRGRLSLSNRSSPSKFIETPFEDSTKKVQQESMNDSNSDASNNANLSKEGEQTSPMAEKPEPDVSQRKSTGRFSISKSPDQKTPLKDSTARLSLASVKSPELEKSRDSTARFSISSFKSPVREESLKDSTVRLSLSSVKSPEMEKSRRDSSSRLSLSSVKSPELEKSRRDSTGRLSLSSAKSPELEKSSEDLPASSVKSPEVEKSRRDSTARFSLSSVKSPVQEETLKDSTGRLSLSSVKSPEMEKSRRDSSSRLSLSSVKSPELEKSRRDSTGRQSESETTSEMENSQRELTGPVKSPELEKSRRDSSGRMSSSIKTPELEKTQDQETGRHSLSSLKSPELDKSGRHSLSSVKRDSISTMSPEESSSKFDMSHQSLPDEPRRSSAFVVQSLESNDSPLKTVDTSQRLSLSLRKSLGRQSLSSVKSSPGFSLKFDITPLDNSEQGKEPSEENEADDDTSCTPAFSNLVVPNSTLRRASTGNLALKKTIELENKSKHRASTGSAFNRSSVKFDASEVKESMSDSFNSSKQSLGSLDDSSSKIDEPEFDVSEEMKLSPIKQDQSDLKTLTLTPSSSDDSYVESANNPLEKSTVFIDEEVSFDSQSAPSEVSFSHEKSLKEDSPTKIGAPIQSDYDSTRRASLKRKSVDVADVIQVDSDVEVVSEPSSKSKRTSLKRKSSDVLDVVQVDSDVEVVSESSSKTKRTSMKRKSSEVLHTPQPDSGEELEVVVASAPSSKLKTSHKSDRVYKDAAFMLNGDVSDGNDTDDSDDNQWQLVFSPATKTKKELRLEKKAKKKAAREAKKKAKAERVALLNSAPKKVKSQEVYLLESTLAQSTEMECSTSEALSNEQLSNPQQDEPVNEHTEIISSEIDAPAITQENVECSERKNRKSMDAELHSSTKKRKSFQESNAGLEVCTMGENESGSGIVSQIPSEETHADGELHSSPEKKTKNKKQKLQDDVKDIESDLPNGIEKKKKKSKKTVSEDLANNAEIVPVEKTKKKKALKVTESEPVEMKKKKKKLGNTSEREPADEHNPGSEQSSAPPKKKTKKLKEAVDGELVEKKKKKLLKNVESDNQNTTDSENIPSESKKKKQKKQKNSVENGTLENDVESIEVPAKKKLKKKKSKPLVEMPSAVNQISEVDNDVSNELTIRKKRKLKKDKNMINSRTAVEVIEAGAGSDSDDAPTSVSFASGKQAALAELQAAAENVKKQKELKRQKLRLKQERIREEKLAKMQRLDEKKKHMYFDEGLSNGGLSSKASFDKDGHQKPNTKPPKRLPADVLESLSEQPPTKLVKRSDGTKGKVDTSAMSKEEKERLERKKARKLALKLKKQKLREADYIPLDGVLGSTRFGVVPLRNIMLAKKMEKNKLAEEAANFRQQNLFGNRIRRTPISSMLSQKEKLKASGKDRLALGAKSK